MEVVVEFFDESRLTKCEDRLVRQLSDCLGRDMLFQIEVVVRETTTGKQRQSLRRLLHGAKMMSRVAVGGAKLDSIYTINDLSFVVLIQMAGQFGFRNYFVKDYPPFIPPKKTWGQRIRDFADWIIRF